MERGGGGLKSHLNPDAAEKRISLSMYVVRGLGQMMKENFIPYLVINPFGTRKRLQLSTSNYTLTPFHARTLGFFGT